MLHSPRRWAAGPPWAAAWAAAYRLYYTLLYYTVLYYYVTLYNITLYDITLYYILGGMGGGWQGGAGSEFLWICLET